MLDTNKEWEDFISKTQNKYLSMILRIINNREDALDILQDVYVNLFLKKDVYNNLERVGYRMATNTAINYYRAKTSKDTYVNEKTSARLEECYGIGVKSDFEDKDYIKALLESIEDKSKLACLELYVQGFKYKEISEILNMPMGTVKSSIFLLRQRLKEIAETL